MRSKGECTSASLRAVTWSGGSEPTSNVPRGVRFRIGKNWGGLTAASDPDLAKIHTSELTLLRGS
jgi:hypothetical protein